MPAPVGSTVDTTALSPTRRQRVSVISGLANGVRRISGAFFGGPGAPVTNPAPVEAQPSTASNNTGFATVFAQGRPTTGQRRPTTSSSRTTDRLPASPAGRTRTSTDCTTSASASTKVMAAGAPSSSVSYSGAGVDGRLAEGRRKSSLHYRVGASTSDYGAPMP
jgi:hypothetical protein